MTKQEKRQRLAELCRQRAWWEFDYKVRPRDPAWEDYIEICTEITKLNLELRSE